MFSGVARHVDQFGCSRNGPECCLFGCFRRADEGDDRAIGRSSRIDVEQFNAIHPLDFRSNRRHNLVVSALGEIRDAFDEFHTTSLGL